MKQTRKCAFFDVFARGTLHTMFKLKLIYRAGKVDILVYNIFFKVKLIIIIIQFMIYKNKREINE